MNWDAIGAIGELVGAAAVVVSIIYLAVQIKQNSRLVRSSGYQTAVQVANEVMESLSSDPETSRIFERAQESYDDLSPDELRTARAMFLRVFMYYEAFFYQYKDGVVDPDIWEGRRKMMINLLTMPGVASWWAQYCDVFGAGFRTYVSEQMKSPGDIRVRL